MRQESNEKVFLREVKEKGVGGIVSVESNCRADGKYWSLP